MSKMTLRWTPRVVLAALVLCCASPPALAQAYPNKPIRILVGFAPGGPNDILARILGDHFQKAWGQPGIVEHKPGLGGSLAADQVAKAAPDGYTLLSTGVGAVAINQNLLPNLGYDPKRDLAPVSMMAWTPVVLSVAAAVPATTLAQFIAHAKVAAGQLNHASPGTGSSSHLAAEAFRLKLGFQSQHIAYRGVPPMNEAMTKGEAQWTFDTPQGAMNLHRQGKVRVLGVATNARWPLFPEIPTMAEQGVGDFEVFTWFGLAAPAATPRPIIDRLVGEVAAALKGGEAAERIRNLGMQPVPGTPEEMARIIDTDTRRWAEVIRAANVKP
ncbi:MAG: tripartite tricarboxylate transporter substrate binding protein [Alphaproteobacteria bacterium]|nr:tripartite tricarboxylate transporter substrate binding protein [Alphaproteobacteria bacterium]